MSTETTTVSPSSSSSPRLIPIEYISPSCPIILLHYSDLISTEILDFSLPLDAAYGSLGLGILVVRGIPSYPEKRATLLPLASKFAKLSEETKKQYEHPSSTYSFGWSHGKEELTKGKPDWSKGSYYNNPLYDDPFQSQPEMIKQYPTFCSTNIWPTKELPELEAAFKELGGLVCKVGERVAKRCDEYVKSKNKKYQEGRLERIIRESRTPKARLLHYFPTANTSTASESTSASSSSSPSSSTSSSSPIDFGSWCGWHNDHGSLTGLCSALYLNDSTGAVTSPSDPAAGLYIKSRTGETVKAVIPVDCLAFQMGETQQIHSGGLLQATPHCVYAGKGGEGISRETFAVFMQPEIDEKMEVPSEQEGEVEQACKGSSAQYLPAGIPTLASRWQNGISFGDFNNQTYAAYSLSSNSGSSSNGEETSK